MNDIIILSMVMSTVKFYDIEVLWYILILFNWYSY
jgi:hypothetical protein